MKPRFKVGDQWVNGLGQPVDEQGEVIVAASESTLAPADAAAGQELLQANADLKADLDKAKVELAELNEQAFGLAQESNKLSGMVYIRRGWLGLDSKSEDLPVELGSKLDELKSQLDSLTKERDAARAETAERVEKLTEQAQSQDKALAERTAEIDGLKDQLSAARQELETAQREGNEAQANAETLKKQVDDLVFKFSDELKTTQAVIRLPDDAKDRLVKVNGIGGKLADEAIAALTAK